MIQLETVGKSQQIVGISIGIKKKKKKKEFLKKENNQNENTKKIMKMLNSSLLFFFWPHWGGGGRGTEAFGPGSQTRFPSVRVHYVRQWMTTYYGLTCKVFA